MSALVLVFSARRMASPEAGAWLGRRILPTWLALQIQDLAREHPRDGVGIVIRLEGQRD